MFTGIVEEMGRVDRIEERRGTARSAGRPRFWFAARDGARGRARSATASR